VAIGPVNFLECAEMELVTKAEKEQLEQRLASLIANRPMISARIAEARAHGDLRENGDYHAAREQQGMDEAEIRRLQERLSNMSVIDEKMTKALVDTVFIGCTVKLRDEQFGDEDLYKLVGEASGSASGDVVEVTANSPMGEALLKAKVGDVVRVNAPRGVKKFTIVEIV
jgi:transcription elongation factor GreA